MASKPLRAIVCEGGSAGTRPDMVLVSFDPDLDPVQRELAFFERDFEEHGKHETQGPCLDAVRRTPAFEALRVLLDR